MSAINFKKIIVCATVLFASLAGGAAFSAQSGAERLTVLLPDDVAGFIAASGCDELKPAFEKTILGQMWYDASTQNFYQAVKTELINKLKQEISDANEAKIPEKILNFAQTLLKRPIIAGAAIDKSNEDFPLYGFVIVDTGTRKSEIAAMLTELEGLAKENVVDVNVAGVKLRGPKDAGDERVYWGIVGNYLVFAANDKNGLAIKYLQGNQNRITPNYLANVQGNGDAVAMYVDFQKISGLIKSESGQAGQEELQKVTAVLDVLGVSDIKAVKSRLGFSGPDLISDEIIELGVQRKGLFGHIKPINIGLLDMVDSRAVDATVIDIDAGGIYDTIMKAIQTTLPAEDYMEMQEAIRVSESEIGFGIRNELLGSFSGPVVSYSMPAGVMTEAPTGGAIFIAGLRNKQSFEKVMEAIGNYASAKSNGMVQVSSQVQDGRTVHTFAIMPLAMMQIMPTWTVIDDYVVVGTNGPLCSSAIKQITAENRIASSVRETAGFKESTEELPGNLVFLSYTDSKAQFNDMMMGAQQFWPMVTMIAANAGIKLPFMLPSLSHIADKMGPSCGYSWFDEDGLRSRYKGTGVEQSIGAIAGGAAGAGVMMPALARVRHLSQRVVSATNLSAIGKAIVIYAYDNNMQYPPDLDTLAKYADLSPKTLTCPLAPKDFQGEHYIYITGQKNVMPPDNVLVYENPEFCREGVNVLFNDAHVAFMKKEEFIEALKKTYERLGKEMPEIKFNSYDKGYERNNDTETQKQISLDENVSISEELSKALQERDIEKAKRLVNQNNIAELSYTDKKGLMRLSSYGGDMSITKLLIEDDFNINEDLGREWTALHYAVRMGHTDLAKYLIDNNADINISTDEKMTPLMFAITHKRKDIEKILAEKGAKTDAFCETIRGNKEAVEELIREDPNVINELKGHFTLLHWAAYKGYIDIAKLLIDKGANVNSHSEYVPPLFWAVRYNRPLMAKLLIDNGADVNLRLKDGITVLHYAAAPEIAEFLIDNGADVNAKTEKGVTPLHTIVTKAAHHEALRTIIDFNDVIADVKSQEIIDKAVQQQLEVVKLLIRNGADPQAKDIYGKTSYDNAMEAGFEPIIEFLSQYNSNNTIS